MPGMKDDAGLAIRGLSAVNLLCLGRSHALGLELEPISRCCVYLPRPALEEEACANNQSHLDTCCDSGLVLGRRELHAPSLTGKRGVDFSLSIFGACGEAQPDCKTIRVRPCHTGNNRPERINAGPKSGAKWTGPFRTAWNAPISNQQRVPDRRGANGL